MLAKLAQTWGTPTTAVKPTSSHTDLARQVSATPALPCSPTSSDAPAGALWYSPTAAAAAGTVSHGKEARQRDLRSDVSNWPTPASADGNRNSVTYCGGNPTLLGQAVLWSTPTHADADKSVATSNDSRNIRSDLERWATPQAYSFQDSHIPGHTPLDRQMKLWPTPRSSDTRSGEVSDEVWNKNSRPLTEEVSRFHRRDQTETGPPSQYVSNPPVSPRLNPEFVTWLMGLPEGWESLTEAEPRNFEHWETLSIQAAQSLLSAISGKGF